MKKKETKKQEKNEESKECTKALKEGSKVELEHRPTIKKFFPKATDKKIKEIATSIAEDHLKELGPDYYKALKAMEDKLKKENKKEKD